MEGNRERQAAELTLLTTMYPSEFSWRSNPPPDLETPTITTDPNFTLTIHPSYALEFTLPDTYPDTQKPHVYLSCGGDVDTSTRKRARAKLAEIVEEQEPGMEMLDLIVTLFTEYLPELTEVDASTADHSQESGQGQHQHASKIKRVVIWSHHLLATSKRKDIQAWSKELSLSGYSRPGHPGSIFVEGDEDQVDEFIRRLKQLRWQALQVRGEETAEKRICGPGDGVLEVEGLGEIAEALKKIDADTADLFLQAMKIAKTD
ncbi:DUF1115-domain-containing protein [Aureobasidium pullulans]|uniref:DUF1115-domain-containing protein n=1 Tax=Aureobasidium pullulans TaxID=5580 RepID=A0A4S8Y6T5_AURPU|nr:DUF1115-domain-containing protein [Aureobasidium pullulans]THW77961.1 DUF1115-domain-containing protein [Aureobasidium pullulans]THZ00700.1 DUF1115-domain-containing protein [Aureobasidium pullulans]TIA17250.1 DUF1115-domain-containing protein [Aureobasidium pullulans]CAC9888662.1 unnamed protein product [Aureobasidium pullulans]